MNLPKGITDKFSLLGALNTLNPFSKTIFKSDTQEWVPKKVLKFFMKNDMDKNGAKTAHFISKLVSGGATAVAAALTLRALLHQSGQTNSNLNKTVATPGQDLQDIYTKPTEAAITKGTVKTAKLDLDPYAFATGAVVPGAVILAALGSFVTADKFFDAQEGKQLDQAIAKTKQQQNMINDRRIRKSRGLQVKASLNKKALLGESADAYIGAGALLLATLAAVAGYNYQRKNDVSYLKYKALKDGISTYAKTRQAQDMAYLNPLDQKLVAQYDKNIKGGKANKGTSIDNISSFNQVGI